MPLHDQKRQINFMKYGRIAKVENHAELLANGAIMSNCTTVSLKD
jgi:ABC-type multidrug transport system fused ATPase/permease subunit